MTGIPTGRNGAGGASAPAGSRLLRALYWLVQWTWGLPQNLLGGILAAGLLIARPEFAHDLRFFHGALVVRWPLRSSMALGIFIFFGQTGHPDADAILVHEYGHTIQSCILGPLYLPVIGLPSLIWAWWPSLRRDRAAGKRNYFTFYTEKWANRCGERVTHESAPVR